MKKYNVFSLYVVKKENVYFICKKDYEKDTYIEFFTKYRIEIEAKNDVKSLSEYYSPLEIMNYKTQHPLMLTKKQILLKYIEINEKVIDKKENYDRKIDSILDNLDSTLNDFKTLAETDPNSAKIIAIENLKDVLADNDYFKSVVTDIWRTYVDSQKDKVDMPVINIKELKKK